MDAIEPKPKRPRKPARPKADEAESATAEMRSLNLRVDAETYERLTIHAMKRRGTISGVVMELAKAHLREYTMPHRVGQRGGDAGPGPIGIVSEAV
jgi:hypothetical protein